MAFCECNSLFHRRTFFLQSIHEQNKYRRRGGLIRSTLYGFHTGVAGGGDMFSSSRVSTTKFISKVSNISWFVGYAIAYIIRVKLFVPSPTFWLRPLWPGIVNVMTSLQFDCILCTKKKLFVCHRPRIGNSIHQFALVVLLGTMASSRSGRNQHSRLLSYFAAHAGAAGHEEATLLAMTLTGAVERSRYLATRMRVTVAHTDDVRISKLELFESIGHCLCLVFPSLRPGI